MCVVKDRFILWIEPTVAKDAACPVKVDAARVRTFRAEISKLSQRRKAKDEKWAKCSEPWCRGGEQRDRERAKVQAECRFTSRQYFLMLVSIALIDRANRRTCGPARIACLHGPQGRESKTQFEESLKIPHACKLDINLKNFQ